jgi:hypothetical protein
LSIEGNTVEFHRRIALARLPIGIFSMLQYTLSTLVKVNFSR